MKKREENPYNKAEDGKKGRKLRYIVQMLGSEKFHAMQAENAS